MYQHEAMCGDTIDQTTKDMARIAAEQNETVETEFNGLRVTVEPGEDGSRAAAQYFKDCDARYAEHRRKRKEWEETPEGIEATRRANEKAERERSILAEENGKPREFALKDRETWENTVKVNNDDYGSCIARYAARWAAMMDAAMSNGATVADCADKASHDADIEGITGFMYGCAVGILAQVWVHGEELRRWHNLKTQIRNEGEKANESGGVLDPATIILGENHED